MKFYSLEERNTLPTAIIYGIKETQYSEEIPDCTRLVGGAAEVELSEQGTKWHDILTTSSQSVKIVSERVVNGIKEAGLTGIDFYPITSINAKPNKRLLDIDPPNYYWFIITGTVKARLERDDGTPIEFNQDRGIYEFSMKHVGKAKRYVLDMDSWDGSDFIYISTVINAHRFFSERFAELIKKNKWTNFVVNPPIANNIVRA